MEYRYDFGQNNGGDSRRNKSHAGLIVALLCIVLVILLVIAALLLLRARDTQLPVQQPTATPEPTAIAPDEDVSGSLPFTTATPAPDSDSSDAGDSNSLLTNNPIPDMVDRVSASVVGILNYITYPADSGKLKVYSSGTGFIVSADGYILTNAHVIDGAEEVRILFNDGSEQTVEVVGSDIKTDIAVLKTDVAGLTPLELGDSDSLRIGDFVVAIGNPLDSVELYGTVTLGIVSAIAREINIDGFVNNYIQTDAAINFGNSGGPLFDMQGRVVGMNSAKSVTAGYDESGNAVAAEGIGFALPINDVVRVMTQLITDGQIERPGIGVTVINLTGEDAESIGSIPGVAIYSVTENGPADRAGLKVGDVFLSVDGIVISDKDDLVSYLATCHVGDVVIFVINRAGSEITIKVTVGDMNRMS